MQKEWCSMPSWGKENKCGLSLLYSQVYPSCFGIPKYFPNGIFPPECTICIFSSCIFLLFSHHVSKSSRFTLLTKSASLSNLINTLCASPSTSLGKMLNKTGSMSLSFQKAVISTTFPSYATSQLWAAAIAHLRADLNALIGYHFLKCSVRCVNKVKTGDSHCILFVLSFTN